MSLIQLLLSIGSVSCLFLYLVYFRSVVRDRLFVLALFFTAMLAVIFPDRTTDIAHVLGVGRGTDLVFYLFILTSVFVGLLLYSKLARIERAQTEIVRALAIRDAQPPH